MEVLVEEQKRSRISVINEDILGDKNLTPAEKMVYARICYFEEFFESAEKTADYLGIKVWTVQSAKRKLEQLGYIRCVKNTGRGKRFVSDVNYDIVENKVRVCSEQSQSLVETKSDVGENKVRLWENQDIYKNINKNISKKEIINVGRKKQSFEKPSVEEVEAYCKERNNQVNAEAFVDFYESKGWLIGKTPMKNWKAAVRTWERNGYGQQNRSVTNQEQIYKPNENENVTYQRMFDKWKQYIGVTLKQTVDEVEACKDLLDDVGEEWLEKLIVALRMRSETNYVIREINAIQNFRDLANNRSLIMSFYNEHWKEWELKVREAQTGRKPWEIS